MRIACFVDTKGKVQHNRIRVFAKLFPEVKFDVFVASKSAKIKPKKYDVIYYASIFLYNRRPVKHRYLCGSITSHKSLSNIKKTLSLLKRFYRVSANNNILYNIFSSHLNNIIYIPNGVDTNIFTFKGNTSYDPKNIRLGWTGNIDRATKNFRSLVSPMKRWKGFTWSIIGTKKGKPTRKKLVDMVSFYHDLDFYVVTSTTEGTPNPALEAASCGVPLISTRVGNMPELIKEGKSGFFVRSPRITKFKKVLFRKVKKITSQQYRDMSNQIQSDIRLSWSWEDRREKYASFLAGEKPLL